MARSLVFVDVETTGLSGADRVVSLAMIRVGLEAFFDGEADARILHLVFNPTIPSDPRARAVHGFSDEELRRQDLFRDHAQQAREWLAEDAVPIAHNASFDRRFIANELALAGLAPVPTEYACTMKLWRQARADGSSAALKAILPKLGLTRAGNTHGALEDAWLAMQVYRHLHHLPLAETPPALFYRPTNWRDASVPASTSLNTASLSPPPLRPETRDLVRAASPMATLLLHVAKSDDGVAAAEVDVLTELAAEIARRAGLAVTDDEISIAAGELSRLPTRESDLLLAARGVRESQADRQSIARWARLMVDADNNASAAEARAVEELSSVFAKLNRESQHRN